MNAAFLGPICSFLSSVTWAFGSASYSKMAKTQSPFSINFTRGAFAFPCFLITALLCRGSFAALTSTHISWLMVSIVASYASGDSLFFFASRAIGVPAALTISSAYPLLTAGYGVFFQGESLSLTQLLGLFMSVGGVALVILSTRDPRRSAHEPAEGAVIPEVTPKKGISKTVGVLLASASTVCWAVNGLAVSRGGNGVDPAVANTVRMAGALILCGALAKSVSRKTPLLIDWPEIKRWWPIFFVETFGGSYFFMYGLSHSPLTIGPTLASVAPVIAVPVSIALGIEKFSWKRTVGVIVVVLGLWLLIAGK